MKHAIVSADRVHLVAAGFQSSERSIVRDPEASHSRQVLLEEDMTDTV